MKKSVVVFAFMILVILTYPVNLSNTFANSSQTGLQGSSSEQYLVSENTNVIYITSDFDFYLQALNRSWPGDGSSGNPYRIENSEFVGNSTHNPIYIKDTTVYFIIKNCTITGNSPNDGIVLENVQHGVVNESQLVGSYDTGLKITYSSYCNFSDFSIQSGMTITHSGHLKFQNCSFDSSVDFTDVDNTFISECTIKEELSCDGIDDSIIDDCILDGGISINIGNRCNITRCNLEDELNVVYLFDGKIADNVIANGLSIMNSLNLIIENNNVVDGWISIDTNDYESYSLDHEFSNNSISGKEVGYYFNKTSINVDATNLASIIVAYSNDVHFHDGAFSGPPVFIKSNNCSLIDSSVSLMGDNFPGSEIKIIKDCRNITLDQNVFETNNLGFRGEYSYNITLKFNEMQFSGTGDLSFYECEVTMRNSSVDIPGVYNFDSCDIRFTGNDIIASSMNLDGYVYELSDNSFRCAVSLFTSTNGLSITRNEFIHAQGDGLRIDGGRNISIIDNKFLFNDGYGIYLWGCRDSIIYGNWFGWNDQLNAYDSAGSNNVWDDGVSIGNAWDDYSGSGVYEIFGSSGSTDRYPSLLQPISTSSTTPSIPTEEFPFLILLFIIIGIAIVALIIGIFLYKRRASVKRVQSPDSERVD